MAAIASIVHSMISYDISRSAREERPLASRSEIRTFAVICKSFHMAEWDMEYPLKGK